MLIVHRIAPQKRPVRPQLSNDSHRDAWLYFESPDAEAAYAALREKGLDAQAPSLTYYGMNQVFVVDPDGYRLSFQSPGEELKTNLLPAGIELPTNLIILGVLRLAKTVLSAYAVNFQ